MKIQVKVIAKAKENKVIEVSDNKFKVKTTKPAVNNQANEAVIKLIAKYFQVKKSQVSIIQGQFFQNKIVEIED